MADERQQDTDFRVLEYIYDNDEGSEGPAGLAGLRELVGEGPAAVSTAGLGRRGLIRNGERLSGGYHVTAEGRAAVENLRASRADRGLRRTACREQLLQWVDSQTNTNPGSRVGRDQFDGSADLVAFTDEETEAAAEHLKQHGLIQSIGAAEADHIVAWITDKGRECIDDGKGVAAFLSQGEQHGSQFFNISGSGNSVAAAIGNSNEVTANLSQFDADIAIQFATAVRQAMPVLDLPEDIEVMLADIAQREDPTRAQRATAMLTTFLMGASTGTLGQVLGMLGANALGIGP